MGFFIALAGMERGTVFSAACLAPPCGRCFCIGILSKEEIFFIRRVTKNVYPLTMGSLFARRDYDIIYTTMSAPFARRRMTHWGSAMRCHSYIRHPSKLYNPLNLLPSAWGFGMDWHVSAYPHGVYYGKEIGHHRWQQPFISRVLCAAAHYDIAGWDPDECGLWISADAARSLSRSGSGIYGSDLRQGSPHLPHGDVRGIQGHEKAGTR